MKKNSHDWLKEKKYSEITVLDPDGWNRQNYDESMNELISRSEFERRLMLSTTSGLISRKYVQDLHPPTIGEYIYMGMGTCNGHVVCMSVAYKLDYSIEKAIQFEKKSNGVVIFDSVNKVKIGQLTKEMSYTRKELDEDGMIY